MAELERLDEHRARIEDWLHACFQDCAPRGNLYDATRYSLLAGGKRLRPVLVLEACRLCGGAVEDALPFAGAIEMVHTYSLIHDDLPCMDDDDLRRGKPTNHKVYGETLAVLAGDAMQPEAFRLLAEAPCLSAENRLEAVRTLSRACGADGMVAGQVLDTVYDVGDEAGLTTLNRLKTGVMISAAAELGCIAAEMPAAMRAQALAYADAIGRGFQIRDDMLDVEGDQAVFGKPIGSDAEEGKVTFVDVIGLDACRREVAACTEQAKSAVAEWPEHDFLWELADRMVGRTK